MTAHSRTVAAIAFAAMAAAAYFVARTGEVPPTPVRPMAVSAAAGPGTPALRSVSEPALPPRRANDEASQTPPGARLPAIRLQVLGIIRLGDGRVSLTLTDGAMTATVVKGEAFGDWRLEALDAESTTFTHLPSGQTVRRRLDEMVAMGDRVVTPAASLAASVPSGPFAPGAPSGAVQGRNSSTADPALHAVGISTPAPMNAPPPQGMSAPGNLPPPQGTGDHVPPSNVPPPQGWHPVVPLATSPQPGSPAEAAPKPN